MSRVGNVENMFGEQFDLVTTNASAARILADKSSSFISSSLIVTSPVDSNNNDIGTPSLLVTDYEGQPLRLTYTFITGGGLIISSNNDDVMRMSIRDKMLKTDENGTLYVDATGLIPEKSDLFVNTDNEIDLDVNLLPDDETIKAVKYNDYYPSEEDNEDTDWKTVLTVDPEGFIDAYTITGLMNSTTSSAEELLHQKIKVNLKNIADGITIQRRVIKETGQEKLVAVPENMSAATSKKRGVVKIDNSTIKMNANDQIYVNINLLPRISASGGPGIVNVPAASNTQEVFYAEAVGNDTQRSGRLRIRTHNLAKMGNATEVVNSTNNAGRAGVGLADGITIRADQNGLIKVVTGNLDKPNGTICGVVRADGSSIKEKNGVLSVAINNSSLACTSNQYGVCKIDNNTIRKNSAGQLYVYNATAMQSEITNLRQEIMMLTQMYTKLSNQLNTFIGKLTTTAPTPFEIFAASTGKKVSIMNIIHTMPAFIQAGISSATSVQRKISSSVNRKFDYTQATVLNQQGSFATDSMDNGVLKIQYAAGYAFSINCSTVTNGYCSVNTIKLSYDNNFSNSNYETYAVGDIIQLMNNTAYISLIVDVSSTITNNNNNSSVTQTLQVSINGDNGEEICSFTLNIKILPDTNGDSYITYNQIMPKLRNDIGTLKDLNQQVQQGVFVLDDSVLQGAVIVQPSKSH